MDAVDSNDRFQHDNLLFHHHHHSHLSLPITFNKSFIVIVIRRPRRRRRSLFLVATDLVGCSIERCFCCFCCSVHALFTSVPFVNCMRTQANAMLKGKVTSLVAIHEERNFNIKPQQKSILVLFLLIVLLRFKSFKLSE